MNIMSFVMWIIEVSGPSNGFLAGSMIWSMSLSSFVDFRVSHAP